jgi:hypothetical protein
LLATRWVHERHRWQVAIVPLKTYTFYDPTYRILLMRGIAWTLNEDPAPFMPLVFHGITSEKGLVGTQDKMMNYENRKRPEWTESD